MAFSSHFQLPLYSLSPTWPLWFYLCSKIVILLGCQRMGSKLQWRLNYHCYWEQVSLSCLEMGISAVCTYWTLTRFQWVLSKSGEELPSCAITCRERPFFEDFPFLFPLGNTCNTFPRTNCHLGHLCSLLSNHILPQTRRQSGGHDNEQFVYKSAPVTAEAGL